jgi:hypothetical protein
LDINVGSSLGICTGKECSSTIADMHDMILQMPRSHSQPARMHHTCNRYTSTDQRTAGNTQHSSYGRMHAQQPRQLHK